MLLSGAPQCGAYRLSGQDLPGIYVSGDNASIRAVTELAWRTPAIDAAVLYVGAARVQGKFRTAR